jgi:hypothetical protein
MNDSQHQFDILFYIYHHIIFLFFLLFIYFGFLHSKLALKVTVTSTEGNALYISTTLM